MVNTVASIVTVQYLFSYIIILACTYIVSVSFINNDSQQPFPRLCQLPRNGRSILDILVLPAHTFQVANESRFYTATYTTHWSDDAAHSSGTAFSKHPSVSTSVDQREQLLPYQPWSSLDFRSSSAIGSQIAG